MKKNKTAKENGSSPVPQLDAILILLGELLLQISRNKDSTQAAREKASVVLVNGGLTQERAAKLLGLKKEKVVNAAKNMKI